jgi:methyl-accepting chemotaxis protein
MQSLKTKLLLATLATVALGFSATLGFVAWKSHKDILEQGEIRALRTAELATSQIENRLDEAMLVAKGVAMSLEGLRNQGTIDRDSINALLKRSLEGNPELLGVYTGWEPNALDEFDGEYQGTPGHDQTGRFIPYWHRGEGRPVLEPLADYDREPYYQTPKKTGKAFISEPYEYAISGKKQRITSLVQPLHIAGRFSGIAGTDLLLDHIAEKTAAIRPFDAGYVSLYTDTGMTVVHPNQAQVGQTLTDWPAHARQALSQGKDAHWKDSKGVVHYLHNVHIVDVEPGWGAVVSVPYDVITEPARATRNLSMLLGAFSLLLTGAVLYLLLSALTRPLCGLETAMKALSQGEGDLTQRLPVHGHDELGRVSSAVNTFLGTLQRMFGEVQTQAHALVSGIKAVSASTVTVSQASESLSGVSSTNAATIEQITVSINQIADHAREANQTMLDTHVRSDKSAKAIQGMETQMRDIAGTINTLSSSLSGLAQHSSQISGIIQVIREIADQTNLLALNAAIEAARAGEQGRGFAVVADEVRKLAERTGSATVEIRTMIEAMRSETDMVVASMDSTRQSVEAGVRRAGDVVQEIAHIQKGMEHASNRVREIAEATHEQSAASTAMAQAIENASVMVQDTDRAIQEAHSTLMGLAATADRLEGLVGRFKT